MVEFKWMIYLMKNLRIALLDKKHKLLLHLIYYYIYDFNYY